MARRRPEARVLAAAAWPLLACFAGLLALDLAGFAPTPGAPGQGVSFLTVLLAAFAALWWGLQRLGPANGVPAAGVLVVAALLRLLALPLTPSLSDDVHRYLWDGRVAAAGENPYLAPPNDERLAPLRNETWRRTAHRDIATVYPPLALGLFSAAAVVPRPLFAYKLGLAAIDLLGCALLLRLARRRGNDGAVLAYVWNPLLVVEGAGMGHVDVLGASLVIACVHLLSAGRGAAVGGRSGLLAGGAAALAVLAKLAPLAALPLWWRQAGARSRGFFAFGALSLLLPATAAVLLWTRGLPPGLVEYALRWEYNGPLYEPLWRLIGFLRLDRAASGAVHLARVAAGGEVEATPWSTLYSWTYPQFLARVVLLTAGAAIWRRLWRQRPGSVTAAFGAFGAFGVVMLTSPTFYPWYLIWILPWAALLATPRQSACRNASSQEPTRQDGNRAHPGARAVLVLSATLPLAYLPDLAGLPYFPWVYGAVWLPPLAFLLIDRRRSGSRRREAP